jgi:ketosteroid isomerase-like protein
VTSSSNLDLVRSLYAAWERGDYFNSAEWADPEIEFVVRDGLSATTWTGLVGMAEGWSSLLSAWEGHRVEADEYREIDDERILVLDTVSARGKSSGLDIGQVRGRTATLFHVRGGRITRLVVYADRDRALADLGRAAGGGAP